MSFGRSNAPSGKLLKLARALARQHLTGQQLADALDWLGAHQRTAVDVSAFVDRLKPPGGDR